MISISSASNHIPKSSKISVTVIQLEEYRKLFLQGDTSYLKEIYSDYRDDVMRVLRSKNLCAQDEAEGHYSEAMIQFYESVSAGKITELKSIKNYLIGICINLIRRENDSKLRIEKKVDNIRLHLYTKHDYKSSETHNEFLIRKVKKQLSNLSERCQNIIIAYYIDGLTMKEIANYLDLSSGDVAKTLKSRCYKTLLKNIKSETNETTIR